MAETNATLKDLKEGSYVMIDGEPCKVTDYAKSKPGKHGSAKVRLEAVGIFDNKKRSFLAPADTEMPVPIIEKRKGQVITVSGDLVQLMDLDDYSTFEANIPEEFRGRIEAGKEVEYWRLGNRVLIKQVRSE